jgi:hypothetical protein
MTEESRPIALRFRTMPKRGARCVFDTIYPGKTVKGSPHCMRASQYEVDGIGYCRQHAALLALEFCLVNGKADNLK